MRVNRAARAYHAGYIAIYKAGIRLVDATRPTALLADFMKRQRPGGRRVVEFGCGEGRDAIFLAKRGFRVVALDTSPAALARARRRAREEGVRVRFVVADMSGPFEFPDASFDLAATIDSFHFITNTGARTRHAHEVYRILKPGGLWFFCNHVAKHASRGRGHGMEWVAVRTSRGDERIRVPRVPYLVGTKEGYVRLCRDAGFAIRTARVTRTSPINARVALIVATKPAARRGTL
ncbi:MAG: class I SAM-dependent methyltransferase [Thermoplasmata archaeon]